MTLLAFCLIGSSSVHSQKQQALTPYFIFSPGYFNLNGNWFQAGADLYLVTRNDQILDISASANMAYFKKKFITVPELGVGWLFNFQKSENRLDPYSPYIKSPFYVLRVKATPWSIAPETGISLLGLLEVNFGYSWEFSDHKHTSLKGFKYGLTLHLPLELFTSKSGF